MGSSHQRVREGKIMEKGAGVALRCLYSDEEILHWDGVACSPLGR